MNSTDNEPGGAGVKQITYSAMGAQTIATTVVNGASASFTINTEGISTIRFFGTDNAGNVESAHTLTIQLTLVSVASNEPDSGQGDIQGFVTGTASTSGQLRAQRLGSGTGRVYTFTYSGSDRAGNTASCTTTVTVPHDQGQN